MKNTAVKYGAIFIFILIFVYGLGAFSVYESYEALYPTFFSGSVTEGVPVNIWYFVSHFLLAEVYMLFYSVTSGIPWYEIFLFAYVAISLFTILLLFLKNNQHAGFILKIIPLVLTLVLATEFILVFQYTRVAFALGIASTLALLAGGKNNKLLGWWSCALFVLCLLSRHEVGTFVFLMQWLGVLLVSSRSYSKTAIIFNTAVFALVFGFIAYDRLTTDDFLKQFEPELGYQLLDRGNIVPLSSMTNAVDSAKYTAVVNLITDQEYTTIAFLRSLVAENAFVGVNKELILRAVDILSDKLRHSLGLLIIYIGLLLIVMRQSFITDKKEAIKIVLFNLSFWLIVVATTYFIMLQYYTLDAMLVMMCFILLSKVDFAAVRWIYITSIVAGMIILTGTVIHFKQQQLYVADLSGKLQSRKKFTDELKRRYPGKILVPGNEQNQMILFSLRPFQMHDFSVFSRLYLFDADVIYIQDNYNAYLRKECNCNTKSYTDFMDFLESKKESVIIISDPERVEVMKYYCSVVRKKNYNIVPIDSFSVEGNSATVYTFK